MEYVFNHFVFQFVIFVPSSLRSDLPYLENDPRAKVVEHQHNVKSHNYEYDANSLEPKLIPYLDIWDKVSKKDHKVIAKHRKRLIDLFYFVLKSLFHGFFVNEELNDKEGGKHININLTDKHVEVNRCKSHQYSP